ncbi:hypothetical protein [Thermoflexus sp.]|uniref:hypothetical protein n=1 Tax=Thermoflexus sp. TaxID=1969742 RepID=UPI0035E44220
MPGEVLPNEALGELPEAQDALEDRQCEVCGFPMEEIHCKLRCPNCGRMRDCSDP